MFSAVNARLSARAVISADFCCPQVADIHLLWALKKSKDKLAGIKPLKKNAINKTRVKHSTHDKAVTTHSRKTV